MFEPIPDEELDLEAVADLALKEVARRLNDPDEAAKLPGTHLLSLAIAGGRMKTKDDEVDEGPGLDPLEIVERSDLPPERKREIIERERKALKERMRKLDTLEDTNVSS